MFQSVYRHRREQSLAHYSSWLTVSQLEGVSNTISFENDQPQRAQISNIIDTPFFQNSNLNEHQCWLQTQVFQAYLTARPWAERGS